MLTTRPAQPIVSVPHRPRPVAAAPVHKQKVGMLHVIKMTPEPKHPAPAPGYIASALAWLGLTRRA